MSDAALDVVEFLLTTSVYSDDRTLDENDLPPSYRRVFWTGGTGSNESEDDSEDESDTSLIAVKASLARSRQPPALLERQPASTSPGTPSQS